MNLRTKAFDKVNAAKRVAMDNIELGREKPIYSTGPSGMKTASDILFGTKPVEIPTIIDELPKIGKTISEQISAGGSIVAEGMGKDEKARSRKLTAIQESEMQKRYKARQQLTNAWSQQQGRAVDHENKDIRRPLSIPSSRPAIGKPMIVSSKQHSPEMRKNKD